MKKLKFTVGNWIVSDVCVRHISSISDGMYYFDDGDCLDTSFVDIYYHLWTIDDAKDGDVLCADIWEGDTPCMIVFDKIGEASYDRYFMSHCSVGAGKDTLFMGSLCHLINVINGWRPATSEERNRFEEILKSNGVSLLDSHKEDELSEFEKAVYDIQDEYANSDYDNWKEFVKVKSKELLSIAYKNLKK